MCFPYESKSWVILLFFPKENWAEEFSGNDANIIEDTEIEEMYNEIQEIDDDGTAQSSSDSDTSMEDCY